MRIVGAREPVKSLRRILRRTQRALFAGAISILAYCGFVMIDTWIFQKVERRQLERMLADREEAKAAASPPAAIITQVKAPLSAAGGLIGRIEIPRLGLSAIIVEGTSTKNLRRAVGHISGTGLPGKPGNIGISGHRDTFFRPLRNIRQNDIITLTTLLGEYSYRVVSFKIVNPREVAVLNPTEDEILTLVTCYPFYFVGNAPARFIVRAERVT